MDFVKDEQNAGYEEPKFVLARDGYFEVVAPVPGKWNLVIVGRGLSRTVISQVDLKSGKNDLGDITMSAGYVLEGTVSSIAGVPLHSARVDVTNDRSWGVSDTLRDMLRGNLTTTTDVQGHFRIAGVRAFSRTAGVEVVSADGKLRSLRLPIADRDDSVTLVARPVGTIQGRLLGLTGSEYSYFIVIEGETGAISRRLLNVNHDGSFVADDLPEGKYKIGWLLVPAAESRIDMTIEVTGGNTVLVDLRI